MKLSLSWNGFDQNISNPDNLKWILSDSGKNFADVFVITNNQDKIGAHRAVLKHGSKFFEEQLEKETKFINIGRVKYEDLVAMMDFIYIGKCEVEVSQLERFFDSAKQFALVGLQQDAAADRDTNDKTEFEEPIKSEPEDENQVGESILDVDTETMKNEHATKTFDKSQEVTQNSGYKRRYKVDQSKHVCSVCKKYFAKSAHLRNHMVTHNGVRSHSCDQCGKAFFQDAHLKSHMMIHKGSLPYSCHLCERTFRQNPHLKIHILTHTGEKPYTCEECGKSFARANAFKEHKLNHTGEKPETCPKCSKAFISRQSLRKHLYTHNKLGSKVCPLCGKNISQGGYLRVHMKVHENGKPHKCGQCNKSFVRSFRLRVHENTHNTAKKEVLEGMPN